MSLSPQGGEDLLLIGDGHHSVHKRLKGKNTEDDEAVLREQHRPLPPWTSELKAQWPLDMGLRPVAAKC